MVYALPHGEAAMLFTDSNQLLYGAKWGRDGGAVIRFGAASTGVFEAATWMAATFELTATSPVSQVLFTTSPAAHAGHKHGGCNRFPVHLLDAEGSRLTDAVSAIAQHIEIEGLRDSLPVLEAAAEVARLIADAGDDAPLVEAIKDSAAKILPPTDKDMEAWFPHLAATFLANNLRDVHHKLAMLAGGSIATLYMDYKQNFGATQPCAQLGHHLFVLFRCAVHIRYLIWSGSL